MSLKETCPKCRKPINAGSGSITQWISVCKCNELADSGMAQNNRQPQHEQSPICQTCGKHIGGGRPGSFTQYVFRQDLCKCAMPEPENKNGQQPAHERVKEPAGSRATEDELSLDEPEKFPTQRYKPLSLLGRGAAGWVYLCRDRLLGKKVAVKTLNKLSADQLVSFQLEAKAASRVKHPYIITVLDFGVTESSCPYMVMEYVNGTTLAQLLEENGVLDTDLAIAIGIKVCDALEYVHRHQMFHRDLKPSNILIVQHNADEDFDLRLIDFGVAQAKFDTQEPTMFQGRTVVGTPNYMSPDQVSGRSFDARSEVYSLGCVLYELLTGSPPFVSHSALETLSKHAHEAPRALSDLGEQEYSENLETLVAKCLEKEPSDRYQSMSELRAELARVSDAEVVVAARAPANYSEPTTDRPIPGYFKVLAGILSFTLIAITWLAVADKPRPVVHKTARTTTRALLEPVVGGMFEDKLVGPLGGKLSAEPEFGDNDMDSILRYKDQTHLSLAGSRVTGKNFSILKQMPLVSLDLSNIKIDDESLIAVSELPYLKHLKLNNDSIGDEGVKHLSSANSLESLDLEYTQVTDSGLKVLSKLPLLNVLSLEGCKRITGVGLLDLAKSKSLHLVAVGDCPRIRPKDNSKFRKLTRCVLAETPRVVPPPRTVSSTTTSGTTTGAPGGLNLTNPAFKKFLRYDNLMYDEKFRTFFRDPKNWKLTQSDIAKIENPQILKCLKDRDYIQDPKVKKFWTDEQTWVFLKQRDEETQNSLRILQGPDSF